MKRVFAAIVTFNRPLILERCLTSILAQNSPDLQKIFIVVNSPDQATLDVINRFRNDFPSLVDFSVQDNIGPAGGFNMALSNFLASDCEVAWCLDDDVVATKGCLKSLLDAAAVYEYVYPSVVTPEGKEIISFGWWGVLLSRRIIEKAGLPMKELFYWTEDSEYLQYRISRKLGVKPKRIENAVVRHLHNRSLKRPSWYYYYTSRNTLYYRIYRIGVTKYGVKVLLGIIPYLFYTILMKEDNKFLKLKMLSLGVYHGLLGRIGKRIDPQKVV